jgi:hypothetical protein
LVFGGESGNSPSVDRIDSTMGYTKDNLQIISKRANQFKSDATIDELVIFSINLLKKYNPDVLVNDLGVGI